jgi:DNA adenine methylase
MELNYSQNGFFSIFDHLINGQYESYPSLGHKILEESTVVQNVSRKAEPFIKWAGGKRSLIDKLIENVPSNFNNYYEPFVGGGALFFALDVQGKRSYISDINNDLILSYNAIKYNPIKLIEVLKRHYENHSEDYYYSTRSKHEMDDEMERAGRFIYLNKTCYNGLYRTNKLNQFNVPIGKNQTPAIVQEEKIFACHRALRSTTIHCKNFNHIEPYKNDFVYLDPPYHPVEETSFTNYTRDDFKDKDQIMLRDFVLKLTNRGVKVMLSNSNTDFIKRIYIDEIKESPFSIEVVKAPRYINCKSNKRTPVKEVIIKNF